MKLPHLDAVSVRLDKDVAFHTVKGIEKHQNQYEKGNGKHHEYEEYHHSGQSGKQKQRGFLGQQHPHLSAPKPKPVEELEIRFDDRGTINDKALNDPANGKTPRGHVASKKGSKRVSADRCQLPNEDITDGRQSRKWKNFDQPNVENLLLPQGETGKSHTGAGSRKKDLRLVGADLYVTRIGQSKFQLVQQKTKTNATGNAAPVIASEPIQEPISEPISETTSEADSDEPPSLSSSTSSISTLGTTGSLHDELRNRSPRKPATPKPATQAVPREAIHDSRPCYRCISYMHAVGIKRVFWTNDVGEWEGGKVANLVDALDGGMDGFGSGGGPMGNGVFVTKHEVLNMRRTMGGG